VGGLGPSVRHSENDAVAFYAHLKQRERTGCRKRSAVSHTPEILMPRAFHRIGVKRSQSQRAAGVRASVVKREECVTDSTQRNPVTFHLHDSEAAVLPFFHLCNNNLVGQSSLPFLVCLLLSR